MSFETSTPNITTKTKRTISLLSTPEQGGEQKKNRMTSDSNCEFNYTVESMAGNENVDNVVLDKDTMMAISQTVQDFIQKSLAVEMKRMVESIITGVVDGLTKRIDILEIENQTLRNENSMLRDRMVDIENSQDASEQYSRRNSVRIFGIPEGNQGNQARENTETLVLNLCKSLGADVAIGKIDRSHKTGKPAVNQTLPIIVKFISYRARQKLYSLRRDLKTSDEYDRVFINEDLTQYRAQLLFIARGLTKSKTIDGAWSADGNILIKITENGISKIKRISSESDLDMHKLRN